jgi:very-short-patch-repair endonuclease
MSPPEAILWNQLRLRPAGLQFRRQHPLGPYVFDFYCRSAGVAIEVDGFAHDCGDNPQRDERRDRWAAEQGIKTIRIATSDVNRNLEGVVVHIIERCLERTPPPPSAVPLPAQSAVIETPDLIRGKQPSPRKWIASLLRSSQ